MEEPPHTGQRLLVVSNRLPVSVEKRRGKLRLEPSTGGLVRALGTFQKAHSGLWIGWAGIEQERIKEEEKEEIEASLLKENCHPIFLTERDIEEFYRGFCNETIWPLFHYFSQYTVYSEDFWQAYKRVNQAFAEAVVEVAKEDDIIWVHDYQLLLLPQLIREKLPRATIGFFLHIPFPSLEIFRMLPWRGQILSGLLGADLVGFHTYDYVWHFLDSVHSLLGYDSVMGQVTTAERVVKADVFPLGIDYENFHSTAKTASVRTQVSQLQEKLGGCKVILSLDRLDYTKGIPERLEAFNLFMERHPEYREKLILVLVAVPSRTRVQQYAQLKKQVDEMVGAINGRYGSLGWAPIWYLYRPLDFDSLVALYKRADIALVTPLRDGMNLIAKEYIATKTDGKGVLVLSETAGAARELGEAIIVNVNDPEEIVQALEEGLAMPKKEQRERNRTMQQRLQRYDVMRWGDSFIDRLLHTRKLLGEMAAKALSDETRMELVSHFQRSNRRLLLLDYDGTLVPFAEKPEAAKPGGEVIRLLKKLAEDPRNEVVVISGRNRNTLEKWFGGLKIGLVAEHGVWFKEKQKEWKTIERLSKAWKEEVRPILELCADRTPGSFIEEKEFSLAWHYRRVNPSLGNLRAREVVSDLLNLTANLNLHVLEGSKVVEVKNAGISKGRAASRWLSQQDWDFILAIGDDVTDEDVFEILPPSAWSIKVRFSASIAKFNLGSPTEVITLLKEMLRG